MTRKPQAVAAKDLAGGFLKALKARRQEVGVWEVRGRVFARVMAAGRDARLSGAEWSVLSTLALHLMHLGRSKGMQTVAKLADDCMVTERTVRNALRTLAASKFVTVRYRQSGQVEIWLDRRFGPRVPVPADKSADGSPRRCAPRKKISTTRNSNVPLSFLVTDECTDSAPETARRESSGLASQPGTTHGYEIPLMTVCQLPAKAHKDWARVLRTLARSVTVEGHDPPRKRAAPVASG